MAKEDNFKVLESYQLNVNGIVIKVVIISVESEAVPLYNIYVTNITETTKVILTKIREEFISETKDVMDLDQDDIDSIQNHFKDRMTLLLQRYFPTASEKTRHTLMSYMLEQHLGLGNLEILLKDSNLEEIVVNRAKEPVWIYHRKLGWLKTNIIIPDENRIRHYSTIIGRNVGKEITQLAPIMDAHLLRGDRVNATLTPISSKGNTITIRKFNSKPWTITDFLKAKAITYEGAALIWLGIQNELSTLICGGTASGKTSMLNCVANFFPGNQRLLSVEDTRELVLPEILHWVPMETRLPNPEGKGGVSMLDLIVNTLRMRPDRIVVGEIRRKQEAEVLFEAMRTGHSVYGTLHANNAKETVNRLTTPPINLPKDILGSLGMIVIQNLNRRTGKRQTLQIAEVTEQGDAHVLMQFNNIKQRLEQVAQPETMYTNIGLYTGATKKEIEQELQTKIGILQWMVQRNITDVNKIGLIMSRYYQNKPFEHIA